MSVSCSKVCVITMATPSTPASAMATHGVRNVGCTAAICLKNNRSSAIAKKMRGDATMLPMSDPNVEIITTTEMTATPICPNSATIVSAAISREL